MDAGGTVIWPDFDRIKEIIFEVTGRSVNPTELFDQFYRIIHEFDRLSLSAKEPVSLSWNWYFEHLTAPWINSKYDLASILAKLKRTHEKLHMWTFTFDFVKVVLEKLKKNKYRLGLISNAEGQIQNQFETLGIAHHFEFLIDSQVVGIAKPDKRIFDLALERAKTKPQEAIYIADTYSIDVLGARQVGLETILIDPLDLYSDKKDVMRIKNINQIFDILKLSAN